MALVLDGPGAAALAARLEGVLPLVNEVLQGALADAEEKWGLRARCRTCWRVGPRAGSRYRTAQHRRGATRYEGGCRGHLPALPRCHRPRSCRARCFRPCLRCAAHLEHCRRRSSEGKTRFRLGPAGGGGICWCGHGAWGGPNRLATAEHAAQVPTVQSLPRKASASDCAGPRVEAQQHGHWGWLADSLRG